MIHYVILCDIKCDVIGGNILNAIDMSGRTRRSLGQSKYKHIYIYTHSYDCNVIVFKVGLICIKKYDLQSLGGDLGAWKVKELHNIHQRNSQRHQKIVLWQPKAPARS
jgi:hypothetical protein